MNVQAEQESLSLDSTVNVPTCAHGSEHNEVPALARRAVETFVREHLILPYTRPSRLSLLQQQAACFVSIKTANRNLRGCIGTIKPTQPSLVSEIIRNAIRAATRDPRFSPITERELPSLRFSVDVLTTPEPTQLNDLNPSLYGVIVEDETGTRRGLLLPDISGIKTAEQQVQIALRKAGLRPGTRSKLYRFRVLRFREVARPEQITTEGA